MTTDYRTRIRNKVLGVPKNTDYPTITHGYKVICETLNGMSWCHVFETEASAIEYANDAAEGRLENPWTGEPITAIIGARIIPPNSQEYKNAENPETEDKEE